MRIVPDRLGRAGGLHQHFVLAGKPQRVCAFEKKISARNPVGEVGEEVARWERSALRVSSKPDRMTGGMMLSVKLESPGAGEAVNCSVGRSPESEEFVALLAGTATGGAARRRT